MSSSLGKLTGLDVIAACDYIFLLLMLFPNLIANCTSSLCEISLSDLWKFMRQNWAKPGENMGESCPKLEQNCTEL